MKPFLFFYLLLASLGFAQKIDVTNTQGVKHSVTLSGGGTLTSTGVLTLGGTPAFAGLGLTGSTITTSATELVLEQTGDSSGATRMRLQNRGGSNGAVFENATGDLVDFYFKGASGTGLGLRMEGRPGGAFVSAPELQFGTAGDPSLVVGSSGALLRRGNLALTNKLMVGGPASSLDSLFRVDSSNCGLRVGYAGASESYWDSDIITFRNGATTTQLVLTGGKLATSASVQNGVATGLSVSNLATAGIPDAQGTAIEFRGEPTNSLFGKVTVWETSGSPATGKMAFAVSESGSLATKVVIKSDAVTFSGDAEITDATRGLIQKSTTPGSTKRFRFSVNDAGVITATELP